ncbi:sensor histidine kinase [Taibaiella helva]|uniref:sensor histidine kinase n=1 Tax=Taibaiella helva TaxID=2301235 RepID=UPI000E59216C|nr:ATP-binding protein [Taibaiella helva]
MSQQASDILITILGGSAILLFLGFTLIFLIIVYRKKQQEFFQQRTLLEENFKKELMQAQLETQEQTFHSLSQELHDNIGQVLSLAKLNMSVIELNSKGPSNESISQTKSLLNTAINDLRDISKTLNTDYVKEKDLAESIERELGMLRRTRKFEASMEVKGNPFFLAAERRLILYRIIQESLNNIVKHAGATQISVMLDYEPDALTITITDNGHGFDTALTPKGVGLLNINHRAAMINSTVTISSIVESGTSVTIKVDRLGSERP